MERREIGAQDRHTTSATIFWFVAALLLLSSAIAKFIRTGDVTWELTGAGLIFLAMGISSIYRRKQ